MIKSIINTMYNKNVTDCCLYTFIDVIKHYFRIFYLTVFSTVISKTAVFFNYLN